MRCAPRGARVLIGGLTGAAEEFTFTLRIYIGPIKRRRHDVIVAQFCAPVRNARMSRILERAAAEYGEVPATLAKVKEAAMTTRAVKVVIHTDKALDEDAARRVSASLEGIPGVVESEFHAHRNHLLIVGYESGTVSAQTVLETVTKQGYSAQLVGL